MSLLARVGEASMKKSPAMILIAVVLAGIVVAGVSYWYSNSRPGAVIEYQGVLEQGIAFFNQQKYPEALQELEKIPEESVSDWQIPYYIGSSQMMLKNYRLAADSLEQALALNSQESGIFYALGVAYYKLGNLKLAKAYFALALEINPADEQAKGLVDIMSKLERQSSDAQIESSLIEPDEQ
jgi:tetratricopeptide (TPR) repeat protein